MPFKVGDPVLYSVPTKFGYEVGRAKVTCILEANKTRLVPLYHIKCNQSGVYKYVDADSLTHLIGEETKAPEVVEPYDLVPATEIV
jgi:hypothetical protein